MNKTISEIRQEFEAIDKEVLKLLAKRCQLSLEMAEHKKISQLTVVQPDVWAQHFQNRLAENAIFQLDVVFLQKFFTLIHEESVKIQNQVLVNPSDEK